MRVTKTYNYFGRDCTMDTQCEHCGHVDVDNSAYDDDHYKREVVPARHCDKCGKNRAGETRNANVHPVFEPILKSIAP